MTEGIDLLTVYCIPVEIYGFDVQVFFAAKQSSTRVYRRIKEEDITLLLCEYPDHRGIWRTTGIRPSCVASDNTQNWIKEEVIRILEVTIKEEMDAKDAYLESSFKDHLYQWGYSEVDQLEYLN